VKEVIVTNIINQFQPLISYVCVTEVWHSLVVHVVPPLLHDAGVRATLLDQLVRQPVDGRYTLFIHRNALGTITSCCLNTFTQNS